MLDHLPGAVAAQCVKLISFDALELVFVGDGVEDADEPGKRVRQRAVEIENHQLILHSDTPCLLVSAISEISLLTCFLLQEA